MFIHLSLHESKAKVLGMPSPEMKNEFTLCCQIINSLESDWYGGHPWIRLAMESESYGGKTNKLYFLFGNRL